MSVDVEAIDPVAAPRSDAAVEAAWSHRHLIDLDVVSWPELQLVMRTTDAMKEVLARPIQKVPALRGRRVTTLFYEASTRTRVSFEVAARNLSADVASIATATCSTSTCSRGLTSSASWSRRTR